ncbi:MAG: glycerol-3-phosphate 1-O-acyltransferase PlsY [Holosporales bacterium]|jgi:glycerol-3-phosphate acyltransferase PlsY|nr:glycerol-3-phosphate 1-O-acyltransferase PlsY [Holosporales bacterium]
MNLIIGSVVGYLIGSIPCGFLLTRLRSGIDLRKFGSGSTGATNVMRVGDRKLAALTLILDALKGAVIALLMLNKNIEFSSLFPCFCCLVGHVYPVWLRFKGGKGVATAAGVLLILSPVDTLISACIWGVVAKFFKISAVASLSFIGSIMMITSLEYMFDKTIFDFLVFNFVLFVFIIFTHIRNIKCLLYKT